MTRETPWEDGVGMMHAGWAMSPARPERLGFAQQRQGNTLRLSPDSPEATLHFTAWLSARRTLVLESGYGRKGSACKLVVRLRDFDGEGAELHVAVGTADAEPWLVRVPRPNMELSDDDRLTIARWAYPLHTWMTTNLVEKPI